MLSEWSIPIGASRPNPNEMTEFNMPQKCGTPATEEMTERYSSVAQAEVEAALGKVVSLAGYRDLLRTSGGKKRSGGKVVGKPITTPTTAAASPSQVPVTN